MSRASNRKLRLIISEYDALNRCIQRTTRRQRTGYAYEYYYELVANYAMSYDAVDNVTREREEYGDGTGYYATSQREVFNTYDQANRLVEEKLRGEEARTTQYAYDAADNRVRKTVDSTVSEYTYNAANQLLTVSGAEAAEFTYDASRNW